MNKTQLISKTETHSDNSNSIEQTSNNRNHAVSTANCEYSSDFWSPVGIREAFFIGILFVVICLFTLRECKKFCILRRSNVESSEQVEDRTLEMMAVVARPATKEPEVPFVKATKVNWSYL